MLQKLKELFQTNPLTKHFTDTMWTTLLAHWSEPHRGWHGINHLFYGLKEAEQLRETNTAPYYSAQVTWLFHDLIYWPQSAQNEALSVEAARGYFSTLPEFLEKTILSTQTGNANTALEKWINEVDRRILLSQNLEELIAYEHDIFKEYQFAPLNDYITKRTAFLKSQLHLNPKLQDLISYVHARTYRIGVYPGSFDPLHVGHMDVIHKAEHQFDKVIVAIGINRQKNSTPLADRIAAVKEVVPFHEVCTYDGSLPAFIQSFPYNITLIRGLRNGEDLDKELQLAYLLEDQLSKLSLAYYPTDRSYIHVSSSAVRQIKSFELKNPYTPSTYAYYTTGLKTLP